jgi:glucosyl-dolichyl phosphate glucuronosyltransferase
MKISVIVSTHNRSNMLKDSIQSLIHQTLNPSQYEIIVGDSYSDDSGIENRELINSMIDEYPQHNISYFYEKIKGGYSLTRNEAVKKAASDLIVFGDDDFIASDTYLEACIDGLLSDNKVGLVTGPLIPIFESDPPNWVLKLQKKNSFSKYYTDFTIIEFDRDVDNLPYNFIWASSFGCKKSVFIECGGFPPDGFSGDLTLYTTRGESALAERAQKKGYSIRACVKMKAHHHVKSYRFSKEYFFSRYYIYGVNASVNKLTKTNLSFYSKPFFFGFFLAKYLKTVLMFALPKRYRFKRVMMLGYISGFVNHHILVKKSNFMKKYIMQTDWMNFDFKQIVPIRTTSKVTIGKIFSYLFL